MLLHYDVIPEMTPNTMLMMIDTMEKSDEVSVVLVCWDDEGVESEAVVSDTIVWGVDDDDAVESSNAVWEVDDDAVKSSDAMCGVDDDAVESSEAVMGVVDSDDDGMVLTCYWSDDNKMICITIER